MGISRKCFVGLGTLCLHLQMTTTAIPILECLRAIFKLGVEVEVVVRGF